MGGVAGARQTAQRDKASELKSHSCIFNPSRSTIVQQQRLKIAKIPSKPPVKANSKPARGFSSVLDKRGAYFNILNTSNILSRVPVSDLKQRCAQRRRAASAGALFLR